MVPIDQHWLSFNSMRLASLALTFEAPTPYLSKASPYGWKGSR